jgi:lycopene beta-cyclase
MIRGIDLYSFVKKRSAAHANIEWRYESVRSVRSDGDIAIVNLEEGTLTADYVFNSILFEPPLIPAGKYFLWQHFTGWLIETAQPCFNAGVATLMDFRVGQEQGTSFMYVMPTSATTALVEYTLFTQKILEKQAYENALKEYISSYLSVKEYRITHTEFGMIPMTNLSFPSQQGRVVYIGIAGGQVKGSSGYAFQFIQKKTKQIVASLVHNQHPAMGRSLTDKKFHLYDSVLLNVLCHRKMQGAEIFSRIFQKNTPERVLRFLDNESNWWEDLKIMQSVPAGIFLPAALRELIG